MKAETGTRLGALNVHVFLMAQLSRLGGDDLVGSAGRRSDDSSRTGRLLRIRRCRDAKGQVRNLLTPTQAGPASMSQDLGVRLSRVRTCLVPGKPLVDFRQGSAIFKSEATTSAATETTAPARGSASKVSPAPRTTQVMVKNKVIGFMGRSSPMDPSGHDRDGLASNQAACEIHARRVASIWRRAEINIE
jgi:hypothetical protein